MISNEELIGRHRAEFRRAAILQYGILFVQVAIAAFAALAVFLPGDKPTYALAGLTGLAVLVWAYLAWRYRASRSLAERVRRATVMTGGFGTSLPAAEAREVMTRFTATAGEGKRFEDSNYYAAAEPPGLARVAAMIEESAFWSEALLRKSATIAWAAFVVFLVVAFVSLFSVLPLVRTEQWLGGVRLVFAIFPLLVSNDVLGAAAAYSSSAHAVKDVQAKLAIAKAAGYPVADMFSIWGDYNSAVESAPMYPPGLYRRHQEELNRLWRER